MAFRQALPLAKQLARVEDGRDDIAGPITIRGRLGRVLLQSRRWKEAEEPLRRHLEASEKLMSGSPANRKFRDRAARTCLDLSYVYYWTGRPVEAEDLARRALTMFEALAAEFPNVVTYRCGVAESYDYLGIAMYGQRRHADAAEAHRESLAMIRRLVDEFGPVPEYRAAMAWSCFNLGVVCYESEGHQADGGSCTQAVAMFEELVEEFPSNDAYRYGMNHALRYLGVTSEFTDSDKILRLLNKAVELDPKEPNNWNLLGLAHYRAARWQQAVEALGKSAALDEPGGSEAWFFLSMSCLQLGDRVRAREWHDQAAEWLRTRDPAGPDLRVERQMADCATEVAKSSRFIEQNPDDYTWLSVRAEYRAALGVLRNSPSDYELALADLARCVALKPEDASAEMFLQGFLHLSLGDIANYRKTCEAMLSRLGDTEHGGTANCVARTCVLGPGPVSNPARVMKLAELALAKQGAHNPYLSTYATLGLALYRAGRFKEARELLAKPLIEGEHGHFCGWLAMAMVQHRLGDSEEARRWLEEARTWAELQVLGWLWWQRLEFDILRKEAEALIEGDRATAEDAEDAKGGKEGEQAKDEQ